MIVYHFWLLDTYELLYQSEIGTMNDKVRNQVSKCIKRTSQRSKKEDKKLKTRQKKLNPIRKYGIGKFCI